MNRTIFPISLAESLKGKAGEKYRPANGYEGEIFFSFWCRHCERDKSMHEDCDITECDEDQLCEIIADTMIFDVDDDGYPHQWTYGLDGQPCCTAYIPVGNTTTVFRDPLTIDMFEQVTT